MTNLTAHTVCVAGHTNKVEALVVDPDDGSAFFGSDYDFCRTCGQPNDRNQAQWTEGTQVNDTPETTSFEDATVADLARELARLVGQDDLLGTPVTSTQIKLGRSAAAAVVKRLCALENEVARLQPPF